VKTTTMNEASIAKFVAAWFQALDFHVPIEQAYGLLSSDNLRMHFPDGEITDFDTFKQWYDRVTNLFFDENHYVNEVKASIDGDVATLDILVGWQASMWEPPQPKSRRVSMDATQIWTVRASEQNSFGMVIESYNATAAPFVYAPGFARL